jgi:hypothetical protein
LRRLAEFDSKHIRFLFKTSASLPPMFEGDAMQFKRYKTKEHFAGYRSEAGFRTKIALPLILKVYFYSAVRQAAAGGVSTVFLEPHIGDNRYASTSPNPYRVRDILQQYLNIKPIYTGQP